MIGHLKMECYATSWWLLFGGGFKRGFSLCGSLGVYTTLGWVGMSIAEVILKYPQWTLDLSGVFRQNLLRGVLYYTIFLCCSLSFIWGNCKLQFPSLFNNLWVCSLFWSTQGRVWKYYYLNSYKFFESKGLIEEIPLIKNCGTTLERGRN